MAKINGIPWTSETRPIPTANNKGKHWKQWRTIFRRLLNDPEFFHSIVKQNPKQWEGIIEDTSAETIAAALVAVITQEAGLIMTSTDRTSKEFRYQMKDFRQNVETLNKIAYGENQNINLDTNDSFFSRATLNFDILPAHNVQEAEVVEEKKPEEKSKE